MTRLSPNLLPKLRDAARCFRPAAYERVAARYDRKYAERTDRFSATDRYAQELDLMVEGLRLRAGKYVLDLGCNTGRTASNVMQLGDWQVVGVEPNRQALSLGRQLFRDVPLVGGNGMELPFRDGSFDAVMINHVLGHVPDPDVVLREAKRVLVKGGRIGVVTPNRHYKLAMLPANVFNAYDPDPTVLRYYTKRSLARSLAGAGFTVTRTTTVGEPPAMGRRLDLPALRMRVMAFASTPV